MNTASNAQTGNLFLDGNFGPVLDEHDVQITQVTGAIPQDLAGNFLRVGPNPVHIFSVELYHTFDGDGMIHAIEFADGNARYRNRIRSGESGLR